MDEYKEKVLLLLDDMFLYSPHKRGYKKCNHSDETMHVLYKEEMEECFHNKISPKECAAKIQLTIAKVLAFI